MREDDSRVESAAEPDLGDLRSFASASRIGAEFRATLGCCAGSAVSYGHRKTDARPEQKTMANSTQQARNIDGSLALNGQPIPPGPVLLVDDMVDSRWTLTVSAWLLRKNGSGEVWPMALSQTGHDE